MEGSSDDDEVLYVCTACTQDEGALLDGGDVLLTHSHCFVGLSSRSFCLPLPHSLPPSFLWFSLSLSLCFSVSICRPLARSLARSLSRSLSLPHALSLSLGHVEAEGGGNKGATKDGAVRDRTNEAGFKCLRRLLADQMAGGQDTYVGCGMWDIFCCL